LRTLDSQDDYVDCGNVGTGVKTVEFWVKPSTNTDHFLDLDGGTHFVQADTGTVTADGFTSPTVYVNGVADGILEAAEWNHVAVTTATGVNANALTLAKSAANYLTGQMDEVRVWNVARSAAQIRDNMANSLQGDESGLVAYYRMDQQNGATLYDVSPNGNDGTLNNMDPTTDWVASAAFNTWVGSDSTTWATVANWSRAAAPEATDNVGIPDYSNSTGYPVGNAPTITDSPTVNHFVLATDAESTLNSDLTINGNLLLNADFGVGANTVTFDGASAQTITGTFKPYNLTIDNADAVDASGATSLAVDNQLTVNSGTFTSASDYHHVSIASGATMALSDDITVSGNWANSGTFTHNDHKVTLDGAGQSLTGDTTFYDLAKTVAAADTLTFEAGSTNTIANALTLQGADGQLLSLRSDSAGDQWQIDPQDTRTIDYLDVKDSNNIDDTNMGAEDDNCTDSGNNTNWFNYTAPTVSTQAVSNIGTTTATCNGNITDLGIPDPTAHGVCWNTTGTPTVDDDKKDNGAASETGAYAADITRLTPGTTYYVRAFATNTVGTAYGEQVEFKTKVALTMGKASSFIVTVSSIEMFNGSAWVSLFAGTAQLDLIAGGTFPGVADLNLPEGTYTKLRITFRNAFSTSGTLRYDGTRYYTTAATFGGQTNLASVPTTVQGSMAAYTFRMAAWGALNANVVKEFNITSITVTEETDYQPTLRFTLSNRLRLMGVSGSPGTYYFEHAEPGVSVVE
jgi:hypothetical protein